MARKQIDVLQDKIPFANGDENDFLPPRSRKWYYLRAGEAKAVKRRYNHRRRQLARAAIQDLTLDELDPVHVDPELMRQAEEDLAYAQLAEQRNGDALLEHLFEHLFDDEASIRRITAKIERAQELHAQRMREEHPDLDLQDWELKHVHGLS